MNLERQYRLLTRAFPQCWRRQYGEDLVSTLLDGSRTDQRIVSIGDVVDVAMRGAATRVRHAGPVLLIMAATIGLALTTTAVHLLVAPTPASFLATSMVVVLIPGTGVVYSVSTAMSGGWQRGSLAALGCTLGIVPHLLAASLGLSGLMQASAEAFEIVRWIGVVYLIYLGVGMLRSSGNLSGFEGAETSSSPGLTVRRGVLLNILNPKLTIFFFAFLPQFLESPPTLLDIRLLGLSGVFMAMTLAVFPRLRRVRRLGP